MSEQDEKKKADDKFEEAIHAIKRENLLRSIVISLGAALLLAGAIGFLLQG